MTNLISDRYVKMMKDGFHLMLKEEHITLPTHYEVRIKVRSYNKEGVVVGVQRSIPFASRERYEEQLKVYNKMEPNICLGLIGEIMNYLLKEK